MSEHLKINCRWRGSCKHPRTFDGPDCHLEEVAGGRTVRCPPSEVKLGEVSPLFGLIHVDVRTLIRPRIPSTLLRMHPPRRSRVYSAVRRPSGAVDPIRPDEHGGPALFGHDPVVLVPVVVLAAGSAEDLSPELP